MADWFVGQKIQYVNGSRNPAQYFGDGTEECPVVGKVYTIRAIWPFPDIATPAIGFLLEEIVNRPRQYLRGRHELHFNSRRFRPVVETKTDIGVFHRMLTTSRIEETV